MPLKFSCPQCQRDIEVNRQYIGVKVPCPQCQATVEVPSRSDRPLAPSPEHHTERSVFSPPRDSAVKLLWVGLILVMITFGIKHLLADAAISSVPSSLQYPKLIAQRDAELFSATELGEGNITMIRAKYHDKLQDARQDALNASASGIGWIQRGIWVKLLVDLPKLLGCLFIVFASMAIVSDPQQDGHVKTYATACSTVILLYTTAYAFMAFLS